MAKPGSRSGLACVGLLTSHIATLAFGLALTLSAIARAQFAYTTDGGSRITITGYSGADEHVAIPPSIDGLKVVAIGASAFQKNAMTSVEIPDGVTLIGDAAFLFCTNLTTVVIPESVTEVASEAFSFCTKLTNLSIPDSVVSLGQYAFQKSTNLTSIRLPQHLPSIQDGTFNFCSSLASVVIPESVTSLGQSAFANCSQLGSITIPNGVTNIGSSAFMACTNLTNAALPGTLPTIGTFTFALCRSLSTITIPKGVTNIDVSAFRLCASLSRVYFEGDQPTAATSAFVGSVASLFHMPQASGWGPTLAGRPVLLWNPSISTGGSFGFQGERFGFTITGTANIPVIIDASDGMTPPVWTPVGTNILSGGFSYFNDPQSADHPARVYRLRGG